MSIEIKTLQVELGERSYPIYIGPTILSDPEIYRRHISHKQVMIVTNATVAPLYLKQLLEALQEYTVESVVLPDGESYKTLSHWESILDRLMAVRFNRQCTVIALGGGVVGDMAGFAAACYQRGVNFVQIPTTLLAQVDSSVGGKTGVNHPAGKNMIGAFYQPKCVIADTNTLNTLDDRQLSAGLAEIIKYGLIDDLDFLQWLEENMQRLLDRDSAALIFAIERSCQDKARIVAADELEAGRRALLNLGHTFGHAIEASVGYGKWLHGEAVAAGMCMAADLSRRIGWLSDEDQARIAALIEQARLPTRPSETMTPEQFIELMAIDKKVMDSKVRLVLMRAIGESLITDEVDPALLRATLDKYSG